MADFKRLPGESDLMFHKRIIYGKLVDGSLADEDFSELAPLLYGREYSSDSARKMAYGSLRTLQLMDKQAESGITSEDILNELELKKIELKKEQQKFYDQRSALTKLIRDRSRQEELNEIITSAIQSGGLPALEVSATFMAEHPDSGTDLLASLNDIHYGADIDNYWNRYDSTICAMMMQRYLNRVIEIGQTHRSQRCVVWANGDLISGAIHHSIAVTNKENVIEQITGVSELIAQFLASLSGHFAEVQFVSVAGNHSRIDTKDRALKDERLDDLVEWYLRARLSGFGNIAFDAYEKVDSTMYLLDIRGLTYAGVHGDYDESASKIQTLQTMAKRPIYAVLSGHLHHCKIDEVQGIKTIMAGSFIGMDDYCVQKRIFGDPEQMVCVCDNTGIVCSYCIKLK